MSQTTLTDLLNQRERDALREIIAEHQSKKRALAELQYQGSMMPGSTAGQCESLQIVTLRNQVKGLQAGNAGLMSQVKDLSHANDELQMRLNTASTTISKVRAAI